MSASRESSAARNDQPPPPRPEDRKPKITALGLRTSSEVGMLPDTKEGRDEGREQLAYYEDALRVAEAEVGPAYRRVETLRALVLDLRNYCVLTGQLDV